MQQTRTDISRKLAGLSLLAFMGMVVLAGFYYYQIQRVADTASYGGRDIAPSLEVLEDLHTNFLGARLIVYEHFQYRPSAFKLGVIESEARRYRLAVSEAIEQYKKNWITDVTDKTYIEQIEKKWKAYNAALDTIIFELHVNTEKASALVERSKPLANEVEVLIEGLITYKVKLGEQGVIAAEEIRQRTVVLSVFMTLAMALAIALGVFIATRRMTKQFSAALDNHGWVKSRVTELSLKLQKIESINDFAQMVVTELAPLLESGAATFYVWDEKHYTLMGSWGLSGELNTQYAIGEGLIGQCAQTATPITINHIPADYASITSGTGSAMPSVISLTPIAVKSEVVGVIEFASFNPMTALQQELVDELLPVIALNLEVIKRNDVMRTLLRKTQKQAQKLQASEEELRMQSEELQASEEELRAKNEAQKETNEELKRQGEALHEAREEANRRADELEKISHYKSDFLSNMSHELRTPLNSLLILAKDLAVNEEKNLTAEQVESAQIIFEGGESLLRLINDILDLSKVEAGKMVLCVDDVNIEAFAMGIQRNLSAIAKSKSLRLDVLIEPDVPKVIQSDIGKMEQIIMNLVGNALKFTPQGGIMVRYALLKGEASNHDRLTIAVEDTGVGIPANKLETIFNAFEQVDSSASREYSGTGLGLSISRRLATLLGGEITVTSVEGKGCTFTLILPLQLDEETAAANIEADTLTQDLLIADDAEAINQQEEDLKQVIVIDEEVKTQRTIEAMDLSQTALSTVANGALALDLLRRRHFDCMVLELDLPDMDGCALLDRAIKAGIKLPEVIVYTNRDLSYEESHQLHEYTDSIVVKSARSSERLADELKRILDGRALPSLAVDDGLSEENQTVLVGKTVLIVEDDMRNAFALSKVLRNKGLTILLAQDGFKALSQLEEQAHIDIVLMDMMMPGKDGYETMAEIRQQSRFKQMPIIALTAKALKSDRKKCLQAGANDYLSKPVDISLLLTAMTALLQ